MRFAKLLLATLASLLPLLAPGESHMADTQQRFTAEQAAASARVLFKIVVPEVLAMDFGDAQPHRMLLSAAGHRAIARFESCTPTEAADPSRGMSCTVSTP
jgi:hypothetical protein